MSKNFRVLLQCIKCDKVYNGTPFLTFEEANRWYFNTLEQCKDVCRNPECDEKLTPIIQEK